MKSEIQGTRVVRMVDALNWKCSAWPSSGSVLSPYQWLRNCGYSSHATCACTETLQGAAFPMPSMRPWAAAWQQAIVQGDFMELRG